MPTAISRNDKLTHNDYRMPPGLCPSRHNNEIIMADELKCNRKGKKTKEHKKRKETKVTRRIELNVVQSLWITDSIHWQLMQLYLLYLYLDVCSLCFLKN